MREDGNIVPSWRVWIDTQRRIVSFHEEEGFQPMEFHSRELFFRCAERSNDLFQ